MPAPTDFHSPPGNTADLEERLSRPTPAVVDLMRSLTGDFMVLGAAGKMGPTLTRMLRRAADEAGTDRRVIAVSRFRSTEAKAAFHEHGIETITCDLLDRDALMGLPDAPNVIHMAGMKFGATGQEPLTWAMNTWLPAVVCEKFRGSRIAAFSTGNVYGLTPATGRGSGEADAPAPVGEYAMSCLGRERMFEHFSQVNGTQVSLIRLNYATDLRYGVLVDIALKVWRGEPVDVCMGHLNTIWQGDANALSILSLGRAASPAWIVNLTGPEKLAVRELALRFGELFGKEAMIAGNEAPDALLSDASRCFDTFGRPSVTAEQLIEWVAAWVRSGGDLLGKPTHFESRDGKF